MTKPTYHFPSVTKSARMHHLSARGIYTALRPLHFLSFYNRVRSEPVLVTFLALLKQNLSKAEAHQLQSLWVRVKNIFKKDYSRHSAVCPRTVSNKVRNVTNIRNMTCSEHEFQLFIPFLNVHGFPRHSTFWVTPIVIHVTVFKVRRS